MGRSDVDARASFEALYRAHHAAVWAYARRRVGPGHDCDDVTTEVFAAAWRHRDDLNRIDLPWLLRAAHNEVLHEYRSSGRRDRLASRLDALQPPPAVDPIERIADDMDTATAVSVAMAQLIDGDQELLRLLVWEQLRPREIATVVGCSPTAARVRIHRASRRLADLLNTPAPEVPSPEPLRRVP
ncbi:RNA polymerase sigma factor [Jatrophihabitans sp. YIM 134969]